MASRPPPFELSAMYLRASSAEAAPAAAPMFAPIEALREEPDEVDRLFNVTQASSEQAT